MKITLEQKRAAMPELGDQRANIKSLGFFHTPKDWPELEAWIERHAPEDRAHIMTAACMAWNLAAKYDAHNEATEAKRSEVTA
jgi:hypothetical protein